MTDLYIYETNDKENKLIKNISELNEGKQYRVRCNVLNRGKEISYIGSCTLIELGIGIGENGYTDILQFKSALDIDINKGDKMEFYAILCKIEQLKTLDNTLKKYVFLSIDSYTKEKLKHIFDKLEKK